MGCNNHSYDNKTKQRNKTIDYDDQRIYQKINPTKITITITT